MGCLLARHLRLWHLRRCRFLRRSWRTAGASTATGFTAAGFTWAMGTAHMARAMSISGRTCSTQRPRLLRYGRGTMEWKAGRASSTTARTRPTMCSYRGPSALRCPKIRQDRKCRARSVKPTIRRPVKSEWITISQRHLHSRAMARRLSSGRGATRLPGNCWPLALCRWQEV